MRKLFTRHCIPFFISLLMLCCLGMDLQAQDSTFFRTVNNQPGDPLARAVPGARTLYVDLAALSDYLRSADLPPTGRALTSRTRMLRWAFPLPDGGTVPVRVVRNHTLSEELAALNPLLTTYTGYDSAGQEIMRLTVSPIGVQGFVKTTTGRVELTPVKGQPAYAVCYYAADLEKVSPPIRCGNGPAEEPMPGREGARVMNGFMDNQLRTYTLSVAATGEYTTWAGSQANALAFITGSVNNINAVYERDLAVHFILNSPLSIIYTNAATDPYSSGALSSTQLNENQGAIDLQVGNANYDVGVLFNAAWNGGLAQLSSVCNNTGKARSAGGLDPTVFTAGPTGKIFDDMICHELGHQFGAHHTMSANTGGCAGNVSGATAWEVGGGFTIMAYGGTCTGLSYGTPASYFHGGNLAEMANFLLLGNGSTCATITPLTNIVPVIAKGPSTYTIPRLTPFKLQAGASDADGDALTYNWEQLDPFGGTGTSIPPVATSTTGPLFRNFDLANVGIRYFPNWTDFIAGNATPYEVLPNATRPMNFRLTVRDNHVGGGATDTQNVVVNVSTCGPFSFTSHNTNVSLTAGNIMNITWNTATACVASPLVNILFSADGGQTFPFVLASNTPNDGSETLVVPNKNTCSGRLLIEAVSSIYYNINQGTLSITSPCEANGNMVSPATPLTAAPGSASLNLTMSPGYGSLITMPMAGNITAVDPGSNLTVQNPDGSCMTFSNQVKYVAIPFYVSKAGAYTFTKSNTRTYNLYATTFDPANPCTNFITSTDTNVANVVHRSNTFTRDLCSDRQYVLVITTFSASTPLPSAYSMTVAGPAGAALYTAPPAPANPGYNYLYVIVNKTTQNVVHILASPDLSNAGQYPAGDYTVYGLSALATAPILDAAYAGGPFSTLSAACINGAICADLSRNSRSITISASLPLTLLNFSARRQGSAVETEWNVTTEENMTDYVVERSYDGQHFEAIGSVKPLNDNSGRTIAYQLLDDQLAANAGKVYYRLKMVEGNVHISYSSIVQVVMPAGPVLTVLVRPNPVEAMINMELGIPQRGDYTWQLTNPAGQVVRRQHRYLEKGRYNQSIPVSVLVKGVYYLTVIGNGSKVHVKIIKL